MPSLAAFYSRPFWPVAMLYAGFYLNAALLEFSSVDASYSASLPLLTLKTLAIALFLYFGVGVTTPNVKNRTLAT